VPVLPLSAAALSTHLDTIEARPLSLVRIMRYFAGQQKGDEAKRYMVVKVHCHCRANIPF
jgi:hypothetical protein